MNDVPSTIVPPTRIDNGTDRGHEPDVINARVVMASTSGLVLLLASVLLLMYVTVGLLATEEGATTAQTPAIPPSQTTPGPEFTSDQSQQLRRLRQTETGRLDTYAWTDEAAGLARIPIDRAMELLAEQGLTTPSPDSDPHHDDPTD